MTISDLVYGSNALNCAAPSSSSNSPPLSQSGGYPTYATADVEEGGRVVATPTLRPVPESFSLGDDVVADLLPGQLAHTYFTLQRNSYVQFNVSVDPQTKLAIYGRQTLQASPTQHDFVQIVQGVKFHSRRYDSGRRTRASRDLRRLSEVGPSVIAPPTRVTRLRLSESSKHNFRSIFIRRTVAFVNIE